MKKSKNILFFCCLLLLNYKGYSAKKDSLFIEDVINSAFKEFGKELKGEFYTQSLETDKPYIYVYLSFPNKVKCPDGYDNFYFCGTDDSLAKSKAAGFTAKGYHSFCYKSFANSDAKLNKRFLSYPKDAEVFIIFHELTHNFIAQTELKIPYDYNEALSDLIGNYGSLNYFSNKNIKDLETAKQQVATNEKIYMCMNSYISKINNAKENVELLNSSCDAEIKSILKECNMFQNDRFNFTVNNAYLVKNQNYCKNYFLLKRVLFKQKSIKALLDILKLMPLNNESLCEQYLLKFT